ncbi:MAG: RNA-binding protein [Pseudomonadota bacterium]
MTLAVTTMAHDLPEELDPRSASAESGDLLDDGRLGDGRTSRSRTQSEPRTRRCIVTRAVLPEDQLIRFVVAPDGAVVADLKRRLPGRGAWVTATHHAVSSAVAKQAFRRAFKGAGKAPESLSDCVGEMLRDAVLGSLGLARKAGLVVTGFAKVESAIRAGRAVAVLHAADAADNGVAKLDAAIRAASSDGHPAPFVDSSLPSGMLSMALGGAHVIHAAVMQDRRTVPVLRALDRYRGFHMPQTELSARPGQSGESV